MTKINLHTHSTFCDGKNTPEEMVLSALEKGFSVLGFSSHSMYPFSSDWHIPSNQHADYVKAIRELAVKYQDRIKILCGFECDYFPPLSIPEKSHFGELKPDYLIGAVHYVVHNNMQATVDDATNKVQEGLERLYKGDGRLCVHDYYQAQRDMLKQGNFEIWAHPDLVRKRNGLLHFFDETEKWYKDEVRETGMQLGIPYELVWRQPFPGPGLAVRIIGEITKDKLDLLREADAIFREEVAKAGLTGSISQYYAALTNIRTVGVMGDFRTYDYAVALRAVETSDFMTAEASRIPWEILERVMNRIVGEVDHVNRVFYDLTSKPPGTVEME